VKSNKKYRFGDIRQNYFQLGSAILYGTGTFLVVKMFLK
jgi:hypothetical protein